MSDTPTPTETSTRGNPIDVEKETKKLLRLRNKALVKAATSTDPDTIRRYERLRNDRILRSERYKQDKTIEWKEKGRVDLLPRDDNIGRMLNRLAQAKAGNADIARQHNTRLGYLLQLKQIRGSGGFKESVTPYGFQKISNEGQNLEIQPITSAVPTSANPEFVQQLPASGHHPLTPPPPPPPQHFSSISPTAQTISGPKQILIPPFQLSFAFPFPAPPPPPPPQPIAVGVIQPRNDRKKARKRPKIEY